MADIKAIAEELVNLTVKEVKELADVLKEEYGILLRRYPEGCSRSDQETWCCEGRQGYGLPRSEGVQGAG